MSNLRKKLLKGALAVTIGTCGYCLTGNIYNLASTTAYIENTGKGYYNRKKDKKFYTELKCETSYLEKILSKELNPSNVTYDIDLYVSEELKRFHDDKDNDKDNDQWTKYVADIFSSLNEYNRAGIGFNLNRVKFIKDYDAVLVANSLYQNFSLNKHKISIYVLAHNRTSVFYSTGLNDAAGFTYPVTNHVFIGLSKNKHRDKVLTLHEVGHVLGLEHEEFVSTFKRMILDPFCVFYKDSFMVPSIDFCNRLTLTKEEINELKSLHED
ncbi:hypothetical protein D6777_03245 [Candidatus Woesearchaeota archaeon]|nr:MAG: hypothetical protein D6777_03245 [Candidatus Woesearchaeota archaeon]